MLYGKEAANEAVTLFGSLFSVNTETQKHESRWRGHEEHKKERDENTKTQKPLSRHTKGTHRFFSKAESPCR
jgi:hypothetical protein